VVYQTTPHLGRRVRPGRELTCHFFCDELTGWQTRLQGQGRVTPQLFGLHMIKAAFLTAGEVGRAKTPIIPPSRIPCDLPQAFCFFFFFRLYVATIRSLQQDGPPGVYSVHGRWPNLSDVAGPLLPEKSLDSLSLMGRGVLSGGCFSTRAVF